MTLHDNKYKHKKSYKYKSPMCIVWLYTITSTNTRNPTNTVTNVYCMTLHDNKYKHKKSYKYVTNVYCMTLHDNKYKHKKSYKYGHQCVLYDFTR